MTVPKCVSQNRGYLFHFLEIVNYVYYLTFHIFLDKIYLIGGYTLSQFNARGNQIRTKESEFENSFLNLIFLVVHLPVFCRRETYYTCLHNFLGHASE